MDCNNTKMISKAYDELELLERHVLMLKITKENQPIGIIRLSELMDIPKHKVRYSLRMLEADGLIVATPDGATVSDKYSGFISDLSDQLDELREYLTKIRSELDEA